jgi:deoxyadenosine/deoxycytidine kinase
MLDRPIQFNYYTKLWDDMINELLYEFGIPSLYIILDGSFETFKTRLFNRNNNYEIENWELNKSYFESLWKNYIPFMVSICKMFGIRYDIINVDNKTPEEIKDYITNKYLFDENGKLLHESKWFQEC